MNPKSETRRPMFTSYERDRGPNESGNDYAVFRTHIPRLGRFNRPDPIPGIASNPQSWNRYAYALNDPINLIDPLGLTVTCRVKITTYYRIIIYEDELTADCLDWLVSFKHNQKLPTPGKTLLISPKLLFLRAPMIGPKDR